MQTRHRCTACKPPAQGSQSRDFKAHLYTFNVPLKTKSAEMAMQTGHEMKGPRSLLCFAMSHSTQLRSTADRGVEAKSTCLVSSKVTSATPNVFLIPELRSRFRKKITFFLHPIILHGPLKMVQGGRASRDPFFPPSLAPSPSSSAWTLPRAWWATLRVCRQCSKRDNAFR